MSENKDKSTMGAIGALYLCATAIGTLIGTVAYFAALTFFALEEVFVLFRKIASAIMQALS